MSGVGVTAVGIIFPRHFVEIVIIVCFVDIQVEGDGLHALVSDRFPPGPASTGFAYLLVGDSAFVIELLPLGGDIEGLSIEHLIMDIVVGGGMRLSRYFAGFVGTHLHTETVFLTCTPDMIRCIDEKLSIVVVYSRTTGMNFDSP